MRVPACGGGAAKSTEANKCAKKRAGRMEMWVQGGVGGEVCVGRCVEQTCWVGGPRLGCSTGVGCQCGGGVARRMEAKKSAEQRDRWRHGCKERSVER